MSYRVIEEMSLHLWLLLNLKCQLLPLSVHAGDSAWSSTASPHAAVSKQRQQHRTCHERAAACCATQRVTETLVCTGGLVTLSGLSGGTLNTWRSGDDGRTVAERLQVRF
jgi:hypothetical protein